ncbi:SDR family oxidoreductase [bacterium]|nr:SDR family oxidoreductase [bacterium]
MKVLVTGGAGFIGSHIVDRLIRAGHSVAVVDDLSTGKEENINSEARFYKLSILSEKLEAVFEMERPDIVNHHAAQINLRRSIKDPFNDIETNIKGTVNILENCKRYNVKRLIFASTGGALYGEQEYLPADEKHPISPLSPYGIDKLTAEKYLAYYAELFGIEYVALRYSNVYGPRQNPEGEAGVISIFIERMLRGADVFINGDGTQTRDFVFVGDVVEANILAMSRGKNISLNIGTGKETSVNTVFKKLSELTRYKKEPRYAPPIPGEVTRSCLDSGAARRILGWSPKSSFDQGLAQTVEYFKHQNSV